ncbi:MAG: type IV pilus assembly protein PilX [Gammaproteobacteria bacterium]|nr:MAG: type IV pilus assembly protein PilX [Gammaproteobacteria bacterium]TND06687.1 MAG: type IV pilus assembly protein PilX [Gammaproteobacteria bacterium]
MDNLIHHDTQPAWRPFLARNEKGSVLIISLLILVVMTLISITSMTTTTVQEKMAGNTRDLNVAFQAAEAALRDGEAFVESIAAVTAFNGGTTGLYAKDIEVDPFSSTTWGTSQSRAYTGTLTDASTAPRYIIELVATGTSDPLNIENYGGSSGAAGVNTFRITARATGKTTNSYIYLQEHYGRAM